MATLDTVTKGIMLGLLTVGLMGGSCGEKDDSGCDTACDTEADTDTDTDTDTGGDTFEPFGFWLNSTYGYDAGQDAAVQYDYAGTLIKPMLILDLFEEDWIAEMSDDQMCSVIMEWDGPIAYSTWTGATTLVVDFGIIPNPSASTVTTDCENFDVGVWGDASPAALLASYPWGAGFMALPCTDSGDPSWDCDTPGETGRILEEAFATDWDAYYPSLIGSGWYFGGFDDLVDGYGNSFAVNGSFQVLDQNGTDPVSGTGTALMLLAADITDGTIPSGAYQTFPMGYLTPAEALAPAK